MKTEIENLTCECGAVFHQEIQLLGLTQYCPECDARMAAEYERAAEERQQRKAEADLQNRRNDVEREIADMTPRRYQQTDIAHPTFNRQLWDRLKDWLPSDETPFLGLIGESGACKTRIAYKLFRDLVMSQFRLDSNHRVRGITFAATSSPDLAATVARQFMANSSGRGSWDEEPRHGARRTLDYLRTCGILLLDDLGKARHTPTVAAEIFAIVDHRHAENLPTLWTANSTPENIVAGMSEDMAGPLAGRLIECSELVTV